jgi:hypothetical protein
MDGWWVKKTCKDTWTGTTATALVSTIYDKAPMWKENIKKKVGNWCRLSVLCVFVAFI